MARRGLPGSSYLDRQPEVMTFMTWEDANLPIEIKQMVASALALYTSPSENAVKRHLETHYVRYVVYESDVLMTFNRDGLRTAFTLLHKLCAKVDVAIARVGIRYAPAKPAASAAGASGSGATATAAKRTPRLALSSANLAPEEERAVVEYEGSLTWHLTERWLASPVRWLLGKDTIITRFSTAVTIDMVSGKVLSQRDRALDLEWLPPLPRIFKIFLGSPAPLLSTLIGL